MRLSDGLRLDTTCSCDITAGSAPAEDPSVGLRDRTEVLKAPPGVAAVAPSTEATLKFKPVLRRWLIAGRTVAAVHI